MADAERNVRIKFITTEEGGATTKTITERTQRMATGFRKIKQEIDGFSGMVMKTTTTFTKFTKAQKEHIAGGQKLAWENKFLRKEMSGGAQQLINNASRINKLGKQYDSFGGAMRMPMEQWKKFNQEGGKFDSIGGKVANGLRKVTHGFRGFRMEMLSVMFFGMMLQRTFMGLLQPALQMSGAMELLSTILGLMFLPVGLALIDFAMALWDWWNALSPETQKFITNMVLLGLAISTVMMIVGQFVLGIGGIIMAFGGLLGPLGLIILALAGWYLWKNYNDEIGAGLSWIVQKVDELWERFLEWGPIKAMLSSLGIDIEKLKNPIESVKGIIGKFWDWLKEEGKKFIERLLGENWKDKLKEIIASMGDVGKAILIIGDAALKITPYLLKVVELLGKIPLTLIGAMVGGIIGGPYGAAAGAAFGGGMDIARWQNQKNEINYSPTINISGMISDVTGGGGYEDLLRMMEESNRRQVEELDNMLRTRTTGG